MTTDARIAARLADLTARRAAIPEDDALPVSTTRGDLAVIQQQRADLDRQLAALHTATANVTALGSAEADERWRDTLTSARATLCAELLQIKSPIRDKVVMGRSHNLTLSIKTIDFGLRVIKESGYDLTTLRLGELMRASGYTAEGADSTVNFGGTMPWFGTLREVEQRLGALADQRARAQMALDAALLTDEERDARDAEGKAHHDALNNFFIKVSSDGSGLVAYKDRQAFYDDEPYRPEDMTPLERVAFERFSAAHAHRG